MRTPTLGLSFLLKLSETAYLTAQFSEFLGEKSPLQETLSAGSDAGNALL